MSEIRITQVKHHGLPPGTLWAQVQRRTEQALASGALQPITTVYDWIEQGGVQFLVRVLANLMRKEAASQQQTEATQQRNPMNPFLPYEKALYVADLSATHGGLLNKYNVVAHHLLIITRTFEDQETWLTLQDFEALAVCMAEIEGLAFYNGGKKAGASQRHKHLQLVPFPLAPKGPAVPTYPWFESLLSQGQLGRCMDLPFAHAIAPLRVEIFQDPQVAGEILLQTYQVLLNSIGFLQGPPVPGSRQTDPYNLLVTREWMMLVPRSQECFEGISINALGFAGTLFVKTPEQLQHLKTIGPMTVLSQVGIPLQA